MEQTQESRRAFLQTVTLAGMATLAAGNTLGTIFAQTTTSGAKGVFVCSVCGHLEFGSAPEACPVCHSAKDKFGRNDMVFSEATKKFPDAAPSHVPVVKATKKSMLVTEEPSIALETKVGKKIHPMEAVHHIRFIDCYVDDAYICRVLLSLRNHPTAAIEIKPPGSTVRVVAWCTLHGYWQGEANVV